MVTWRETVGITILSNNENPAAASVGFFITPHIGTKTYMNGHSLMVHYSYVVSQLPIFGLSIYIKGDEYSEYYKVEE